MDPSQEQKQLPKSDHEKEKIERLRRLMYSRALSGQIKEKERRELPESKDAVSDDWTRLEPVTPSVISAPRGITIARTLLRYLLVLAVVFFTGSMVFFGYYFTFGAGSLSASANNVDIVVMGPPQVSGGEPTKLQVSITNHNRVALELASLVVTYPDGTRSVSDFATPLPTVREDLQVLQPGETKQGVLNAVFSGQTGETKNVKVELEYHLSGSNAIFIASRDYALLFGSSPLTISVEGNASAIAGQPVSFVVSVASNADAVVRDVILRVDYPFGFSFVSADPAPTDERAWSLGDIYPGQRKTITIDGQILGQSGDDKVFNFTAGGRTNASSTDIASVFAENPFRVNISQPFLGLSFTINRSSNEDMVLAPGDTANIVLSYVNNLPVQVTDAVIVARLSGVPIDGGTVQSSDGFYRSSDGVILWDKSTTDGALGIIPAGGSGTVGFSFKIPPTAVLSSTTNPYIDITVNARGNRLSEAAVPQNLQSVVTKHIAVASDLQFAAQGLYFQNPFGVAGPLPPKADNETNYAIVFTIKNTTNRITNAKITAAIPPYVRWLGSYAPAAENLTFNQNSSVFTWDLGTIEPGLGIGETPPRQLAISLGFNPSTSQVGQQPVLLQNAVLTGIDESTGAAVRVSTRPDVTTDLIRVSRSSGQVIIGTDKGFSPDHATVVR